jgi:hypothetical protein
MKFLIVCILPLEEVGVIATELGLELTAPGHEIHSYCSLIVSAFNARIKRSLPWVNVPEYHCFTLPCLRLALSRAGWLVWLVVNRNCYVL